MLIRNLLVAAFMVSSSGAYAANKCEHPWSMVVAAAKKDHIRIIEMSAKDSVVAVENYNAIPPVSADKFDHIYVASKPGDNEHLFVFFTNGGCVKSMAPMSLAGYTKLTTPAPGV